MNGLVASICGLLFAVLEIALGFARRARRTEASVQDHGSLGFLWAVIGVSCFLSYQLAYWAPDLSFGEAAQRVTLPLGLVCFVFGLSLRWYAIRYLGRYFTVNVAIAHDHRVIDTGPYRSIRHPSYTGALMGFLGIGLMINNAASLGMILVPPIAVFLYRIRIEEAALSQALGEAYRDYMRRTRRLIPGLY